MHSKTILQMSDCVNVVSSVAVEKDGAFLLVEEAKPGIEGLLNFPSGKVNYGETPEQAAVRECLEETGHQVEVTDLCSIYYVHWDDMPGVTIRFQFWAKLTDQKPSADLADDVKAIKWLNRDELEAGLQQGIYRGENAILMVKDVLAGRKLPLDVLKSK